MDRAPESVELCAPGVYRLRTMMVNVFFLSDASGAWTLVDTGMPGYARTIRATAARLFGDVRPAAIVLTHGHFDHIGGLPTLARDWGVPVYAHPLELPYLTGRSPYPPPDPTVGGGLMALMSPLFPRGPIDLGERVRMLPENHGLQSLTGWRWIHTPGHTPGHISLFRDVDRVLISGDAFVTTRQESFVDVLLQREQVWRPPAYYTSDWDAARKSVEVLAALEPDVIATGHGHVLRGAVAREGLRALASGFRQVTPTSGRYVGSPAVADEGGVVFIPPRQGIGTAAIAIGAAAAIAGAVLMAMARARRQAHA